VTWSLGNKSPSRAWQIVRRSKGGSWSAGGELLGEVRGSQRQAAYFAVVKTGESSRGRAARVQCQNPGRETYPFHYVRIRTLDEPCLERSGTIRLQGNSAPVPSNFSSGRRGSGTALPQRCRGSLLPWRPTIFLIPPSLRSSVRTPPRRRRLWPRHANRSDPGTERRVSRLEDRSGGPAALVIALPLAPLRRGFSLPGPG
jgi:hypothetical protein